MRWHWTPPVAPDVAPPPPRPVVPPPEPARPEPEREAARTKPDADPREDTDEATQVQVDPEAEALDLLRATFGAQPITD